MKLQDQLQQAKLNKQNVVINYTNYVSMFQLNFNENPFNKINSTPTLLNSIKHHYSMINLAEKAQQLDSTSGASSCDLQYKPYSQQQAIPAKQQNTPQPSFYLFQLYAFLLLIGVGVAFTTFCFFPLVACFIPSTGGNPLLEFFKDDEYYCFLFPLMFPLTVLILYGNWVGMKFFRHS